MNATLGPYSSSPPPIFNNNNVSAVEPHLSNSTFSMGITADLASLPDDGVFSGITSVFLTQYIIIILGFLVGHFKLLSKAQTRGLGRFVHQYAISAILFMTTTSIQLDAINWPAIWAIFLSRLLMFSVGTLSCLLISRGGLLGLGAIVSLLLTDTNDIAVIYTTFRILYPSMASHCCIVVILQILILKPVAFFLLEMNAVNERRMVVQNFAHPYSAHLTYRTLLKILCQILLDPPVIAFGLGLIFNVVFHNKPPVYLTHSFNAFGETFISCALFYLGLVCVNSGTGLPGRARPLLTIILSVKVLLMPLLATKLHHVLPNHTKNAAAEHFILLYSLSPANANLLILSSRHAVAPNLVGANISIGTFLLLPSLFIHQGILYLLSADPAVYAHFLEKTAIFASWISLLTGLWTRIVFIAGRKTRMMPHRFVICYLDCTLVTTGVAVLGKFSKTWLFDPAARETLVNFTKFLFYLSADYCTRIWTAFICIGMLIQKREGKIIPRRNRTVFYIFGLITPIILTVSMKIRSQAVREVDVNPFYQSGCTQQKFTLAVLAISLLGTIISLIMLACTRRPGDKSGSSPSNDLRLQRRRRSRNGYTPLLNGHVVHEEVSDSTTTNHVLETIPLKEQVDGFENELEKGKVDAEQPPSQEEKSENPEDPNNVDGQVYRHFILVGLNIIGIMLGIFSCLWRLLRLKITTTIIILEFLDQAFNFGQGFFVFALYGSDVECITKPIIRFCSKLQERISLWFLGIKRPRRHGRSTETEGDEKSIKPTRQPSSWRISESFALRYLDACVTEICKPIELKTRTSERAFLFADFRDWLLKRNLCCSLEEVLSLLLALELNDYVRGLSVSSVYVLDAESCKESVFEFIRLD
ncbi:hypothetical protein Aperf_G00000109204 [Anoplocephala perfoliata]